MDRRLLLVTPYLLWLFALVLAPFSIIISTSLAMRDAAHFVKPALQSDAYRTLLDPLYLEVLGRTVLFAGLHTTITIALAYPVAFFLSRLDRREAGMYITLLLVPFWTNFLIRLLAFMDVLRMQPFGIQWTFTFHGMVAAMVYNMLPFAILPLYAALEKVPDSVLEAAQDLGASKRRILWEVLWPLTRPAVFATALLVFIPALGEYLTPELVGGGQSYFIGTFLQQQFLFSRNWPVGAAAITILILLSVVLVGVGGKALEEHS
jgi:spermidine/putrescine transport system permease protein